MEAITHARKPARAFTLIELLVVVAIIAILVALLFPVFASAREKARQATCASNEMQIGLGIAQYLQDNDEEFPYSYYPASPGDPNANAADPAILSLNGIWWPQIIQPYINRIKTVNGGRTYGGNQVLLCPDMPTYIPDSPTYKPLTSYATNHERLYPGGPRGVYLMPVHDPVFDQNAVPATLMQVTRPDGIVLVVEEDAFTSSHVKYPAPIDGCAHYAGATAPCVIATYSRHSGGSNALFVDGHVKWLPATDLLANVDDIWAQQSI